MSIHVLFSLLLGTLFFIPLFILVSLALNFFQPSFALDRFYVIVGWVVLYGTSCVVANEKVHDWWDGVTWKFDEEGYLNRIERIRAIRQKAANATTSVL